MSQQSSRPPRRNSESQPASGRPVGAGDVCCSRCDGCVETELVGLHPGADVCLECMDRGELDLLEQDINDLMSLDRELTSSFPELLGWQLHSHFLPSRVMSGDFYDLLPGREPKRLWLLIGDVMGKGLPAALLRTGLQAVLRTLCSEYSEPAVLLAKTNLQFMASARQRRFASLFLGVLDPSSGLLRYANAGHLPPLLRHRDGRWLELATTGMAIGVRPDANYTEREVTLEPGSQLVLYTDGVSEAPEAHGVQFGLARLKAAVEAGVEAGARGCVDSLLAELNRFTGPQVFDDQTLLVLSRDSD